MNLFEFVCHLKKHLSKLYETPTKTVKDLKYCIDL